MAIPSIQTGVRVASGVRRVAERIIETATPTARLPLSVTNDLTSLAKARPDLAWRPGQHISTARNAHYSHTPSFVEHALRGEYNSIEADIRLVAGQAVVAHDANGTYQFTLDEMLGILGPSNRMVRLDIKDAGALDDAVRAVRAAGIDDRRLTFNFTVAEDPRPDKLGAAEPHTYTEETSLADALRVRAQFPNAHIGLNVRTIFADAPIGPNVPDYSPSEFDRLAAVGNQLGGAVMVAIEAQHAKPWMVEKLKRSGVMVGAWNDTTIFVPPDAAPWVQKLRDMGFDGQIDVRDAHTKLLTP